MRTTIEIVNTGQGDRPLSSILRELGEQVRQIGDTGGYRGSGWRAEVTEQDAAEEFRSRGIGKEWDLTCFVCGCQETLMPNIAAFVKDRESGKRIVAMFRQGARLDFRESEPGWVQVKIGACMEHLTNLQDLSSRSREANTISPDLIAAAEACAL